MKCVADGCQSTKIRARHLCAKHWNFEQYGACKNGCTQPARDLMGLCNNCIKRNGAAPTRKNNGKCNKCNIEELVNYRCPVCDINRKKNENLVRRYGITLNDWTEILTNQGDVCKICNDDSKKFVVDHDHRCCAGKNTCGKCVRGIICDNCNKALGLINDSTEIAINIVRYLERSQVSRKR